MYEANNHPQLTVPRGTLGGAYRRTYLHPHARYRGWVGGVRAVFACIISASRENQKKQTYGMIWSGAHDATCITFSKQQVIYIYWFRFYFVSQYLF